MANQEIVDPFVANVQEILHDHFRDAQIKVHRNEGASRVSGFIVTPDFDNLDQLDRQRAVHNALRDALGVNAQGVSIILTYTPAEYESLREE